MGHEVFRLPSRPFSHASASFEAGQELMFEERILHLLSVPARIPFFFGHIEDAIDEAQLHLCIFRVSYGVADPTPPLPPPWYLRSSMVRSWCARAVSWCILHRATAPVARARLCFVCAT